MFGRLTVLSACVATLLTACGGGGSDVGALVLLSSDTAQGWAADAQAMPVSATTAAETATRTLEAAVAEGDAAAARGPGAMAASVTLPCASGGSVTFSVSGGSPAQQLNGRMDAGEVYEVSFSHCGGPTPGAVLDGSLTLSVIAYSATAADLDHNARALRLSTAQGSYVLNGNLREQRSTVALGGGGRRLDSRLSSNGLVALQSQLSGRLASYELRQLDWTVECTLDATGMLVARAHQGSLLLAVNTLRRPAATLQVTTQGSLAIGGDGMASQGSFSIATSNDRVSVSYSDSGVSVALDLGNNGSIDRRWTLTRLAFIAEVG